MIVVIVVVVALALVIGVAVMMRRTPMALPVPSNVVESDPQLGRRVYANCQACHGIDGRGVAGYAPALVAAPSLADDGRSAILKIVLGGNRVAEFNAVMPGFSRLSDTEVAAVMTYIRSAWGNNAAPVEVATVAAVRRTVADPRHVP